MWRTEKTGKDTQDLIFDGVEKGIANSPTKGTANIQNANISTETGEVMCSYGRVQQSQAAVTSGTLNASVGGGSYWLNTASPLKAGTWITIGTSSITSISNATTYYVYINQASGLQLSANYDPTGANPISHGTSGTATFSTFADMGSPIAKCTEEYTDVYGAVQYRYYVLDANGRVWVYDTEIYSTTLFLGIGETWFLPDTSSTYYSGYAAPSGIAVLNGWLMVFTGNTIWVKATSNLGATTTNSSTWVQMTNAYTAGLKTGTNPHFAFVGQTANSVYYTDGNYIGKIQATNSFQTSLANIQSYSSYTSVTTTGTITALISGAIPWTLDTTGATAGIPAVFFTTQAGTQPSNLSVNVVYYIRYNLANSNFGVYDTLAHANAGGATGLIDITAGAAGPQYFNTFFPIGVHAGVNGDHYLMTLNTQAVQLPTSEIAQCMVQVGNTIIIGGISNILYPWNQIDPEAGDFISLPESNTKVLINVNNMAYAFVGNKGNIYITNTSTASAVITVPDYCAGLSGFPSTYIEPYFSWGDAMYLRGRVYFSILDQTAIKSGNCGGVWSFIPTQNLFFGQDVGLALRLENQNSYGTYKGVATVLIPAQNQQAIAPQYWSGWYSSISAPTYGIDGTGTYPTTTAVIETDLAPIGTMLDKKSYSQIEYKLSSPLVSGDSVQVWYRLNATDDWITCGTVINEGATSLSGYFIPPFQNTQWVQFQIRLIPNGGSTSSFIRFVQLRVR